MRLVEYTNPDGFKHLSWLRDRDPDEDVAAGIPHDPPALDSLGLDEENRCALHNALVERRLVTWQNTTIFKTSLAEAAGVIGLDTAQAVQLHKLYTHGPPPILPGGSFDLQAALDALPYTDRQRDCIKRTFASARIRCLADVQNAPTRVGHICGLDIYLIVAHLMGRPS